jgi:hypothetical protein
MWDVAMAALIGTLSDWLKLLIAANCYRVIKGIYIQYDVSPCFRSVETKTVQRQATLHL